MWLGGISCQSVWGVIFQWGSTLKVSIELPATSRHRRDMTEKGWKPKSNKKDWNWEYDWNTGKTKMEVFQEKEERQ